MPAGRAADLAAGGTTRRGTPRWPASPTAGLVDADGAFTETGTALRQHIEDRTDALALAPWAALGADGCDELRGLVRPLSKAIVESGTFGLRPPA